MVMFVLVFVHLAGVLAYLTLEDLEHAVEKYGWEGLIDRCTFKGEHCKMYFRIRERGYSEHVVEHLYNLQMELYSEKSLRLLMQKTFMGGFELERDQVVQI